MTQTSQERGIILVVDDNVTNLKVASEHLKAEGYQILTSRDGESAIERVKFARPDLILLDVQMPGIDGFETCRRLKQDSATKNIPVIFTTVLTTVEDKLRGFASGGVDYVPKPFQVEELLARVNTHLTIYKLQRDLEAEIRERKLAEAALRKANLELQRLAVLDGLTQIANRRRFDEYLLEQWTSGSGKPLSLILCDVDFFKRYNDGYGHQAGDRCLQLVAQAINRAVGYSKDLAARYGGEEFVVVLPDTNAPGAKLVAELIHKELHSLALLHEFSEAAKIVTLSMGVATVLPTPAQEPASLIAAADAALYRAKKQGRNQAVIAEDSLATT